MHNTHHILQGSSPFLTINPIFSLKNSGISLHVHNKSTDFIAPFCQKCRKSLLKKTVIRCRIKRNEVKGEFQKNSSGAHQNIEKLEEFQKNQESAQRFHRNYCVVCFCEMVPQIADNFLSKDEHAQYSIVNHLEYPLTSGNWSTFYEIMFIKILEKSGCNWEQAEEMMSYFGANYRAEELQMHYEIFYARNQLDSIKLNDSFIKKRTHNPKFEYSLKNNPYASSSAQTYSSDNISPQENSLRQWYERYALKVVLQTQDPPIQSSIAEIEFASASSQKQTQAIPQDQVKYRILENYSEQIKIRQQKIGSILRFQQIVLENNGPKQTGNALALDQSNLSARVKDMATIYQDLFPVKADQNIFSVRNYALKYSKGLMRYLNKQNFYTLTQSISLCLKMKRLVESLSEAKTEECEKNAIKSILSLKNDQEEFSKSKPQKKQKRSQSKKRNKKSEEMQNQYLNDLGFESMQSLKQYLMSLKHKMKPIHRFPQTNLVIKKLNIF